MKLRNFVLSVCWLSSISLSAQTLPYQDPSLTAHQRAVDLCGRLTLEEKAQLMLDESPAIPRLGIKKFYWWSEALHGVANLGGVTVFPEPIAMASSFNPDLLYRVFSATSDEMRAQYHHRLAQGGDVEKFHSLSVWTPNVNIFRDPRWGRGQETYGEDPWLTSVMGCAVVRGLQGLNRHVTASSGPVPNTMLCTAALRAHAIRPTSMTSRHVICGRPICRHSNHLSRTLMCGK